MNSPIKLTDILALAVTHQLATGFNVLTMPPRLFISIGEKEGASCPLDGGLTKAEDGLEQRLSSRRISSEQVLQTGSSTTQLGATVNGGSRLKATTLMRHPSRRLQPSTGLRQGWHAGDGTRLPMCARSGRADVSRPPTAGGQTNERHAVV